MEDSDDDEDIIDHYAILSISDHASPAEIRKAYLKASRAWHPDKNLQNPEHARTMFQFVSDAYEILSDANQRKVYDQLIDSNPTPSHGSPSWRRSAPPNRGRATTADSSARSSSQRHQNMSSAFTKSFGAPGSSFESAVNSWDQMMEQLLEPVRRRSVKRIQRVWRGHRVRKTYGKLLRRRNKQRRASMREREVLMKAQRRVEREEATRQSRQKHAERRKRSKTAPDGKPQPHAAKGQLFGPAPPPIPYRKPKKLYRAWTKKSDTKRTAVPAGPAMPAGPAARTTTTTTTTTTATANFHWTITMVSAATQIQRSFRQRSLRLKQRALRQQRLLLKQERKKKKKKNAAAIEIQKVIRGKHVRTGILKAAARAKASARKRFIRKVTGSVICLQSRFRGSQARFEIQRKKLIQVTALTKIQRWQRNIRNLKKKEAMKKAKKIIRCVKTIQSLARMRKGKRKARIRSVALKIQRDLLRQKQSTVLIQSFTRTFLIQSTYRKRTRCAVIIQCWWRVLHAQKECQQNRVSSNVQWLVNVVTTCFETQDMRRGWKQQAARQAQMQLATKKISCCWRKHRKRKKLLKNICLTQFAVRRWIARDMLSQHRRAKQNALIYGASTLQRIWRGYSQRMLYVHSKQACIRIQSCYRTALEKKTLEKLKEKRRLEQRLEQQRVLRNEKCLHLQCWYRALSACLKVERIRCKLCRTLNCVILQCWYRSIFAKRQREVLKQEDVAMKLKIADCLRKQWWKKRSRAAHLVQRAFRRLQERKQQRRNVWTSSLIQVKAVLLIRNIISSHRAHKWQQEHSSNFIHDSASKFPSRNIKRVVRRSSGGVAGSLSGTRKKHHPLKNLALALNVAGMTGSTIMDSSPNRTRRQRDTRTAKRENNVKEISAGRTIQHPMFPELATKIEFKETKETKETKEMKETNEKKEKKEAKETKDSMEGSKKEKEEHHTGGNKCHAPYRVPSAPSSVNRHRQKRQPSKARGSRQSSNRMNPPLQAKKAFANV